MKTRRYALLPVVLLLLLPVLAEARGGGGIEYIANAGPEFLGGIPLPGGMVVPPTGTVTGLSGFGYGITHAGWKIGGFGTWFMTGPLDVSVPGLGGTLSSAVGGFGGVLSGGHGRLGPVTVALNTRFGAGGVSARFASGAGTGSLPYMAGTFALFGSIDLEAGLIIVPAMMVSAYAGVSAVLPLPWATLPVAVPSAGIRVTWGSF